MSDTGKGTVDAIDALLSAIEKHYTEQKTLFESNPSGAKMRRACMAGASKETDIALQRFDYEKGAAKKHLKKARQAWCASKLNSWTRPISEFAGCIEYWHEDNLTGGGSGGWEAKLAKELVKYDTGKYKDVGSGWHGPVTHFLRDGRTSTFYGYRFKGEQGPHTVARILGIRSRSCNMERLATAAGTSFKALGCSHSDSIHGVDAMFAPYTNLAAISSLALSKLATAVSKMIVPGEGFYDTQVKMFKPDTLTAREAFKRAAKLTDSQYSQELHAVAAHNFFGVHYGFAKKKGDLLRMVLLGQILADLHPLSTVTTKQKATHSDTKGGGEGASVAKLDTAIVAVEPDKVDFKAIATIINGDVGKNKGLVDMSSIAKWAPDWQKAFEGYRHDVLKTILANYGLDEAGQKKVLGL